MEASDLERLLTPATASAPAQASPLEEWTPSEQPLSLGVEVELQLVDAQTRHLVSQAPAVLDELRARHPDEPRYEKELMQNTVEVTTEVCPDIPAVERSLRTHIGRVIDVAGRRGLSVMAAGSHPRDDPYDSRFTEGSPRIDELLARFGRPVREMQTFGMHVHVGIRSGNDAIRAGNVLLQHLPQLLALSASSPFWNDRDSGLASSRCPAFNAFNNTGLPPVEMETWADYQRHYEDLLASGSISSNKDVHYDVRPSPRYGTIELRIADATPTIREACAIAAYTQCLVADMENDPVMASPLPLAGIAANKSAVVEGGINAVVSDADGAQRPAWYLIERDLERLLPVARRLGCEPELRDCRRIIDEWGTSAERQRATYASAPGTDGTLGAAVPHERLDSRRADAVTRTLNEEMLGNTPLPPRALADARRRGATRRARESRRLAAGDAVLRRQQQATRIEILSLDV
jgi:carboxylate-amine ligase